MERLLSREIQQLLLRRSTVAVGVKDAAACERGTKLMRTVVESFTKTNTDCTSVPPLMEFQSWDDGRALTTLLCISRSLVALGHECRTLEAFDEGTDSFQYDSDLLGTFTTNVLQSPRGDDVFAMVDYQRLVVTAMAVERLVKGVSFIYLMRDEVEKNKVKKHRHSKQSKGLPVAMKKFIVAEDVQVSSLLSDILLGPELSAFALEFDLHWLQYTLIALLGHPKRGGDIQRPSYFYPDEEDLQGPCRWNLRNLVMHGFIFPTSSASSPAQCSPNTVSSFSALTRVLEHTLQVLSSTIANCLWPKLSEISMVLCGDQEVGSSEVGCDGVVPEDVTGTLAAEVRRSGWFGDVFVTAPGRPSLSDPQVVAVEDEGEQDVNSSSIPWKDDAKSFLAEFKGLQSSNEHCQIYRSFATTPILEAAATAQPWLYGHLVEAVEKHNAARSEQGAHHHHAWLLLLTIFPAFEALLRHYYAQSNDASSNPPLLPTATTLVGESFTYVVVAQDEALYYTFRELLDAGCCSETRQGNSGDEKKVVVGVAKRLINRLWFDQHQPESAVGESIRREWWSLLSSEAGPCLRDALAHSKLTQSELADLPLLEEDRTTGPRLPSIVAYILDLTCRSLRYFQSRFSIKTETTPVINRSYIPRFLPHIVALEKYYTLRTLLAQPLVTVDMVDWRLVRCTDVVALELFFSAKTTEMKKKKPTINQMDSTDSSSPVVGSFDDLSTLLTSKAGVCCASMAVQLQLLKDALAAQRPPSTTAVPTSSVTSTHRGMEANLTHQHECKMPREELPPWWRCYLSQEASLVPGSFMLLARAIDFLTQAWAEGVARLRDELWAKVQDRSAKTQQRKTMAQLIDAAPLMFEAMTLVLEGLLWPLLTVDAWNDITTCTQGPSSHLINIFNFASHLLSVCVDSATGKPLTPALLAPKVALFVETNMK